MRPQGLKVSRLAAFIQPTDRPVTTTYEVSAGHYYLVRATTRGERDHLVVVRATGERMNGDPMFVLAPGERTECVGSVGLLIIADLGEEAP